TVAGQHSNKAPRSRRRAPRAKASPLAPSHLSSPVVGSPNLGECASPPVPHGTTLFDGSPAFQGSEAVLFDSDRPEDAAHLPDAITLTALRLEFPDGTPAADPLDAGLVVLLFVEDMAAPRARVRLADLVRQGGGRPVNLRREAGQRVRLVLADTAGAWAGSAPKLRVGLRW